jgi:hypothetical protein
MHTRSPLPAVLLATLLAGLSAPVLADDDTPGVDTHQVTTFTETRIRDGAPDGLHLALRGPGRMVKNAPYSALAVSERLQQLADGNQIERRTRTASYRDSAGRTRLEVQDDKGNLRTVTINDPVANTTWILNPRTRSATRLPRPDLSRIGADAARTAAEAARTSAHAAQAAQAAARSADDSARSAANAQRSRIEQMRKEGKLPGVEVSEGPNGRQIVVRRIENKGGGQRETVRVIEVPALAPGALSGADPQVLAARIGPLVAGAAGDAKWAAKAVRRDLGTREFDGVKAEGKLRSYEIPAGEVGNRAPIEVADESWYAPDLQVTVYARHSDPRSGDYVYRLEDLKRGEPDSALFTVPADYKVRDVQATAERRVLRKIDDAK